MPKEIILKKLEQIRTLLEELKEILDRPSGEFLKQIVIVRAAERNFQLIVELASDVNAAILVEKTGKTPDTYRQSFADLKNLNVFPENIVNTLIESAKLRNILTHEYDFEEDYEKFYRAAQAILPAYQEYIKLVYAYIKENAS